MTRQVSIVGYATEVHCDHCGRALKHGVRIDDGRTVGATCLVNKLTVPRRHMGKVYRYAAETVVHMAKVVERVQPGAWDRYGVNAESVEFELA